jgi:hypothetical protein
LKLFWTFFSNWGHTWNFFLGLHYGLHEMAFWVSLHGLYIEKKFLHFSLFSHFNLWEFHLFSHLLKVHLTLIFTLDYHIFPSPLMKAPFVLTWEFFWHIFLSFGGFPFFLLF